MRSRRVRHLARLLRNVAIGLFISSIGGRAASVDWLFSHADAVLAGTVKKLQTGREIDGSGYPHEFLTLLVSISHSYKGNLSQGPVTVYAFPEGASLNVIGIHEGETAILFVRNSGGRLQAINPVFDAEYLGGEQLGSAGGGMAGLESDLALGLEKTDADSRTAALIFLSSVEHITPAIRNRVEHVSAVAEGRELIASLAVLVQDSQPADIGRLASLAAGQPALFESNPDLMFICSGGISLTSNSQSFNDLRRIAESHVQAFHFGALMSLRRIRNPKATPLLVRMLDDPDKTNQYEAVIGLVEVTGKVEEPFAPSLLSFDKRPGYYIQNWKDWWEREGRLRY